MALEHVWPMIAMQNPEQPKPPKAALIADEMVKNLNGTYRMTLSVEDLNIAMQIIIAEEQNCEN